MTVEAAEGSYDVGEHVKEVFAYFGRAVYEANVVETGLAIAVMQIDFLGETVRKLKRDGRDSFNRAEYEASFDAFMDRQHALTFGNLIRRLKALAPVPEKLAAELNEAKTLRDFLIHGFWRDRAVEFATREGRDGMIAELQVAHNLFFAADRAVDEFGRPYRHAVGLTEAEFERHYAEFRASLGLEDDEA